MAGCDHATMAQKRAGKGSDTLVSPQAQRLPWRQSVAEPQTIFTRERQSSFCSSWVLYNRSLRVQLFWSWPHILSAKALVDKIYAVVWRSMLSSVGGNHERGLSGPSTVDLVSVEDWTSSTQTACLSYGCLHPRVKQQRFFFFIDSVCHHSHAKVWGSEHWKACWRAFLSRSGHRGSTGHSPHHQGERKPRQHKWVATDLATDPLSCYSAWMFYKTKRNRFSCPAASTVNSHHQSHLSRRVNQRSPRPRSSMLGIMIPLWDDDAQKIHNKLAKLHI